MTDTFQAPLAQLRANRECMTWRERVQLARRLKDAVTASPPSETEIDLLEFLAGDPKWDVRLVVAQTLDYVPDFTYANLISALSQENHANVKAAVDRAIKRKRSISAVKAQRRQAALRLQDQIRLLEGEFGAPLAKKALQLSERHTEVIVGSIVHNLRSILTHLITNCELLMGQRSAGDEEATRAVKEVTSVALSEDGKRILTGSDDMTAIMWEATTGKKLQTFQGHTSDVWSMALSPDCRQVATGSWDKTAVMWDAFTEKKLQIFEGHTGGVGSVALSGDGKQILTGSDDMSAILWEAATGKKLQTFQGHTGRVASVAVSSDGKQVVTGSGDKTAILWDAGTGKKLQTFQGHTSDVWSVALSRDGKQVMTGSGDKTAILWEAKTGKKLQIFQGHTAHVGCVAISGDGKQIATASWDKTAILWEAATGKKLQTFQAHTDAVDRVALSGDGKRIITGSMDKTAILWEAATGKKLQTFEGHTGFVWSVALSEDGKHVWTSSIHGRIRLWSAATGGELCQLLILDAGKDWLVATPEGLFDGSKGAWKLIAYRNPSTLKLLDDEAILKRYHRLGLLDDLWKGEQPKP